MNSVVNSSTVISVPVKLQVQAKAQGMKELVTNLQDTFSSTDITSGLWKQLNKIFNQIDSKSLKIDSLLGADLFTQGDLKKVDTLFGSIVDSIGQISQLAQKASPKALGLDLTEIEEFNKKIIELQESIKQTKNLSVGSILGKDSKTLKEFSEIAKDSGFDSGKSFTQNLSSMDRAMGRIIGRMGELTSAADEAKQKLEEGQGYIELARARAADQITSIKGTGKDRRAADVREEYKQLIGQQIDGAENFITGGRAFSQVIAEWLDFSPEEISLLMQKPAKIIIQTLQEAVDTQAKKNPNYGFGTGKLRENAAKYASKDKVSTEEQYQAAIEDLMVPINNLKAANELLEKIRAQIEELGRLKKEYENQVNEDNRGVLEAARQLERDAEARAKAPQMDATNEIYNQAKAGRLGVSEILTSSEAEIQAKQEAEQFSANLRQSVSHWMSAQQVVNLIKQGVRQAWQDIQGLDKAMTNIAVVTDMSVSDLWGKINEYMSVAQQYGVTTQGVYEVSQLYYQQGLNANEVMAATTETLKMARIAGMQYAEAADGMTVAIRGFSMEMEEANHVTDVYSKVAA